LSARWRIHTLVGCTFFACQVIPYFAVGTFVAQLMSALHLRGGYVGGLIYNFSLFAGAIAGLLIVDRISRRSFLVGSFAAAAVAMLILSLFPNVAPAPMVVLFAVFAGVLSAASKIVYVYLPELFPTDLRASGIGLAIAASRIGSAGSNISSACYCRNVRCASGAWRMRRGVNDRGGRMLSLGAGDKELKPDGRRSCGGDHVGFVSERDWRGNPHLPHAEVDLGQILQRSKSAGCRGTLQQYSGVRGHDAVYRWIGHAVTHDDIELAVAINVSDSDLIRTRRWINRRWQEFPWVCRIMQQHGDGLLCADNDVKVSISLQICDDNGLR
jgi:hypothetical protein